MAHESSVNCACATDASDGAMTSREARGNVWLVFFVFGPTLVEI